MPDWTSPEKVLQTIQSGDEAESARGRNRVLINKAANNEPLMDEDEAKRLNMKIFNRWGELMGALADARRQYLTNFMSPVTFFQVSIPKAPDENRADWEGIITETINDLMKEGENALEYFEVHRSKWSGVVSHGIGAVMWEDKYSWLPRYIAIEDLRVPTDTELSFRNLTWSAVRVAYTPGELSRKAFSKEKGKFKWDTKRVAEILENIKECNAVMAENNYDFRTVPEKFEELRKQNCGYWSGDAMPTINMWHFYHQDDDKKWHLKVVPERNASGTGADVGDTFICESEGAVADNWRQIIHVQYGDLNNKAPFLFHSVRSLGFSLFEPCYWTDFTRCKLLQHTLDQFNIWLRSTDPVDRARAQVQVFQNLSVIKPGISIIPQTERHQVDAALVEGVMAQTKQLQSEASTSYTQSTDTGTSREQTAFEVGVKVQKNNAMLSGLMLTAAIYEKFKCKEICRRFCLKDSDDEDVKSFRKTCKESGIPEAWLDSSKWRIEITMPLGNGNPTMAMVESQNALQLRPMLDPQGQQEALHDAAVQMVGAKRARRWVKTSKPPVSDAAAFAAAAFPNMMLGMPPIIPAGLNPMEQIQTLIDLATRYVVKIESTTKIPRPDEMIGLQNVSAYIGKLIQDMNGDTANEPRQKEFVRTHNQLDNELKKLGQKLQMEMQKQQGESETKKLIESINYKDVPEDVKRQLEKQAGLIPSQAPITDPKVAKAAQDMALKEKSHHQIEQHKDISLAAEEQRKNVETVAEIERQKKIAEAAPPAPISVGGA
jgi:hypothetical protein